MSEWAEARGFKALYNTGAWMDKSAGMEHGSLGFSGLHGLETLALIRGYQRDPSNQRSIPDSPEERFPLPLRLRPVASSTIMLY